MYLLMIINYQLLSPHLSLFIKIIRYFPIFVELTFDANLNEFKVSFKCELDGDILTNINVLEFPVNEYCKR